MATERMTQGDSSEVLRKQGEQAPALRLVLKIGYILNGFAKQMSS